MTEQAKAAGENPQKALWNGSSGCAWVDEQPLLDRLLEPLLPPLVRAVEAAGARRVLDVGCGTGATTIAIARRLGADGRCTGIDLSEPMIALARERAARDGVPADFILADAQHHDFGDAAYDLIVSRFGVMFFQDPVAAFANLRTAVRPGGGLDCIAWRGAADNGFMTTAERAAAPCLPELPPRNPDGPGQFGFADEARVSRILAASGWSDAKLAKLDVVCTMSEAELETYFTRLGPVGMALGEADAETRKRVIEAVRAAFAPFVDKGIARFTAACWQVTARA